MLNAEEFATWCQRLQLVEPTKALISEIRAAPPARRVRSAAGNVSGRYPSRKMGVTIQFESHRVELAAIYAMEHDPQVLEFYDQPPAITLTYAAKSGRPQRVRHTPDFFVLYADAAGWEEWKAEAALPRLAECSPHRYGRGADGRWRCPPGEEVAERWELTYRVRSSAELPAVAQRNLQFLDDYFRLESAPLATAATAALLARVAAAPGIALAELLDGSGGVPPDDLYAMLAQAQLYVDLDAAPLVVPTDVRVYLDQATAQAHALLVVAPPVSVPTGHALSLTVGTPLRWDGRCWTLVNDGETTVTLLGGDGAIVALPTATVETLLRQGRLTAADSLDSTRRTAVNQRLLAAGPAEFQEANRRYACLVPYLVSRPVGRDTASPVPARTLRRWLARYRAAAEAMGCGYAGLLPCWSAQGNRRPKLPPETLTLLEAHITQEYESLKQKRKLTVYGALVSACAAHDLPAPSYKTFVAAIRRRPHAEQARRRQGARAAYQVAPVPWELAPATPRHGDRPFEIGHIDHTELDVELVCSTTGRLLGRPWATFLTDAYSRRLLAVGLSFDPPSYRACMLVLRVCVQRHSRLPQTVVVDGGKEFASIYFETLLARYECTKKTRPGAQPRFGSVCERLFGTTNTRFIHNLLGNTQLLRTPRLVTKAVDPRGQACWTFAALFDRLNAWAYEVYDTLEHPALGRSPREAATAALASTGERAHRRIPYDEDFRMLTLPTTRKGTAKVQPGLGVKLHTLWYWSDAFRDPAVERQQVPVRYDPFDAGAAYAFVRGRWVHCRSEHYTSLQGRSERELALASAELRRRQQCHAQRRTITAVQLATFLTSVEGQEVLLLQHLRDMAAHDGGTRPEAARAGAGVPGSATDAGSRTTVPGTLAPVDLAGLARLAPYGEDR